MRFTWIAFPAALIAVGFAAGPAAAYVGPGAGLGVLTALWGLLIAVAMAVGFIVLWPVRRYLLRRRSPQRAAEPRAPQPTAR